MAVVAKTGTKAPTYIIPHRAGPKKMPGDTALVALPRSPTAMRKAAKDAQ